MALNIFEGQAYFKKRFNFIQFFSVGYRVVCKIGEGSFSEVLKVQDIQSGEFYAAKKLKKFFKNDYEIMSCSEISAVKRLEYHPNLVGIVDILWESFHGNVILVFNLMDMSLYDYIKSRKRCLSEAKVKHFLYQLVCGLNHLHCNGLYHRDIKPENVLIKLATGISYNRQTAVEVKIADFGSVCNTYTKPPHTAYISTRWYRAPECLLTYGYYGPKMDIWALGCVFYEMLTLTPLFPGSNELDQLCKIHEVLGTPSSRTLAKFKHMIIKMNFPRKTLTGFYHLSPVLSEKGIDILTKTLSYHPYTRINTYGLLNHAYFDDLRPVRKSFSEFSSTPTLIPHSSKRHLSTSVIENSKSANGITENLCKLKKSTSNSFLSTKIQTNKTLKDKERAGNANSGAAKTTLISKTAKLRKK